MVVKDGEGATSQHFNPMSVSGVTLLLLGAGAKVDARDGEGRTPLHGALERGSMGVAMVPLHAGADGEAKDDSRATPGD
jgi:ankyrin repeat protein